MYCISVYILTYLSKSASQKAKYVESWPSTTSAWLAGADMIFQWIGMVEYIPC
jgi:hypothetical protein